METKFEKKAIEYAVSFKGNTKRLAYCWYLLNVQYDNRIVYPETRAWNCRRAIKKSKCKYLSFLGGYDFSLGIFYRLKWVGNRIRWLNRYNERSTKKDSEDSLVFGCWTMEKKYRYQMLARPCKNLILSLFCSKCIWTNYKVELC